jgi:hypothetical protein
MPASEKAGRLYYATDGYNSYLDTGSVWNAYAPALIPCTSPVDSQFSWVNQGSATTTQVTNGGVYMTAPSPGSGDNWHLRVKSIPTAPYTVTMGLIPSNAAYTSTYFGLVLRNSSSGNLVVWGFIFNTFALRMWLAKYNSPTSFSADYFRDVSPTTKPFWLRMKDDNTNRIAGFSADGVNYTDIHSIGRTDFTTPDQIGYGVGTASGATQNNVTIKSAITIIHWAGA